MFLAGILLKLGGYGLIRVLPFSKRVSYSGNLIFSVSLYSLLFISLLCVSLLDIKIIIAFSSVAHIGMALGGLWIFSFLASNRALMIFITHGVSSSGIFYLRYVRYKISHSRRMVINKGLMNSVGLFIFMWVIGCIGVIGAPPLVNLWVEISSFIIIINKSPLTTSFLF
jgi:NADH:ubiquinone oxidoreductase subunit 4 (subunit M)